MLYLGEGGGGGGGGGGGIPMRASTGRLAHKWVPFLGVVDIKGKGFHLLTNLL